MEHVKESKIFIQPHMALTLTQAQASTSLKCAPCYTVPLVFHIS